MCILSKAHFVQCRVTKLVPCVYLFAAITHFVHQFHRDFVCVVLSSQFLQLTSAYSGPNAAQSTEGTTIIIALCYINVHKICHCFHHGNFILLICLCLIANYVSRVSLEAGCKLGVLFHISMPNIIMRFLCKEFLVN